jgi:hypothetical protein
MTDKEKLNKAFRELRKLGYTAKQNFMCCQNCAWHALSDEEAKKAVFYHRQDSDSWGSYGKLDDDLYLAWSGNAAEIVAVLRKHGLLVAHDGSANQRIVIQTPESMQKELEKHAALAESAELAGAVL